MSEQANIQTVQQIYADFGKGDIPAILARLSPDVTWVNAGPKSVPYAGRRQGVDGARQFFTALGASLEVTAFEPKQFFANGNDVVVLGAWSGRAKPTGKTFASDWAMAWTLRGDKITSFRAYEDTYVVAAAFEAS